MENKAYYLALNEFIKTAGMTQAEFADYARMHPEILKECFNTQSKLIIGTFLSIAMGCVKVIEETADESRRSGLQKRYTRFFDAYLSEWPNEFLSVSNPHFHRRVEEMAKAAGEAVYVKIRGMYHPDELVETAEETGILLRRKSTGCAVCFPFSYAVSADDTFSHPRTSVPFGIITKIIPAIAAKVYVPAPKESHPSSG